MSSFTENLYLKRAIQQLVEENLVLRKILSEQVPAPHPTGKPGMRWTPEKGHERTDPVGPGAMQFSPDEMEGLKRSGTYAGQHPTRVLPPAPEGHVYPGAGQPGSVGGIKVQPMDPAELARKRAQIDADQAALFAREGGRTDQGQTQGQTQRASRVQKGKEAQQRAGELISGEFLGAVSKFGQQAQRIADEAKSREEAAAKRAAQVDPERSRRAQERRVADANRQREAAFGNFMTSKQNQEFASAQAQIDKDVGSLRRGEEAMGRGAAALGGVQSQLYADSMAGAQERIDAEVAQMRAQEQSEVAARQRSDADKRAAANRASQVDPERSRRAQERREAGKQGPYGGYADMVKSTEGILDKARSRRGGNMPAPHPTGKPGMRWTPEKGHERTEPVVPGAMKVTKDEMEGLKRSGTYAGQHPTRVLPPAPEGHNYPNR